MPGKYSLADIEQPTQGKGQFSLSDIDTPAPEPGYLDKQIPLTSYGAATEQGFQTIGRGVRDAVVGIGQMLKPPTTGPEKALSMIGLPAPVAKMVAGLGRSAGQATQVPAAVSDINASPDPAGTYAKVAQDTAGQGAGQALTALATEGAVRGVNAIPSASRAGAALQNVRATVGDVPIGTAKVGDTALEIYTQSQRGANLPTAVGKLVRRMTAPEAEPLTYAEAKDFQSNISKLSTADQMRMTPNVHRLVGQLNMDLKGALADAADTAGKGQQFQQAMREYHNAMKVRGFSDAAIKNAWKVALGALGAKEAAKILGIGQ